MDMKRKKLIPTMTHWGSYLLEIVGDKVEAVHNYKDETHPSPIGQSLINALDPAVRIDRPMVRAGYLEKGIESKREGRGSEPFVAVEWDDALDLVAEELRRVKQNFDNSSIYAGSYGWASAGRFHHAQSQIHRFMKKFGGYTDCVDSYSFGAGEVIHPHVLGTFWELLSEAPSWEEVTQNTELVVLFGGVGGRKNSQVNQGGIGRHTTEEGLFAASKAGVQFVNISPIQDDLIPVPNAEWISIVPGADTAVMLAIAHTLVEEGLHDKQFLSRYCHGFERFLPYLLGEVDGQSKNADWAQKISEVSAVTIRQLARRMASNKTNISISWSVQRADYGEQPVWMAIVLAAMLGEIGLPGRGYVFGYGAMHSIGSTGFPPFHWGALPQGKNPVKKFIPVARLSDMLLNPGATFDYNGQKLTYPDIRLVYWAGGNPFHHHQDLNRLIDAWRRPETIIINEHFWTATARHSDIILPVATMLERNDFGGGGWDHHLSPMPQAVPRYGQARTDYEIFTELASRLDFYDEFTLGRNEMEWVRELYEKSKKDAAEHHIVLPDFESFWQGNQISILDQIENRPSFMARFREDPENFPLQTPSGKIEIFSEAIDSFGYRDCPGHPTWFEPKEWLHATKAKTYPLHLISNQPETRLHSQYDHGVNSSKKKIMGREPCRLHPTDAAKRGIKDGDLIRIYNDRGACLSAAILSTQLRERVVQLSTGAWYDPIKPSEAGSLEIHGNPNVLTADRGTSRLSQATTAYSTLVEVELYSNPAPPIKVFKQPKILDKANQLVV